MSAYLDFIECLNDRLALHTYNTEFFSWACLTSYSLQGVGGGGKKISIEDYCIINYSSRQAILCIL